MALKKLDAYGIKMADLKKVVTALNKSGLLKTEIVMKKVGQSGPALLTAFITGIDTIADDATADIPEVVADFYEAIPQEVYDDDKDNGVAADEKRPADTPKKSKGKKGKTKDTPEEKAEKAEKAADATDADTDADTDKGAGSDTDTVVESECPTFKTGWDDKEEDCVECANEFPAEYDACKAAVTAKAKTPKKGKGKAKAKDGAAPKPKKAAGKRTCYGHMIGSMAGCIDEMVAAGTTKEDMVKTLEAPPFNRDKVKAAAKIAGHILVLVNQKGITIEEDKKGVIKGNEQYTEGQTAENTGSMHDAKPEKPAKKAKGGKK